MEAIINNTFEWNEKHAATLLGQRPAGSVWATPPESREELIALCKNATEIPAAKMPAGTAIPICRYFQLQVDGVQRFTLGADLPKGATVKVVAGAHGLELQTADGSDYPVSHGWLIVGPAESEAGEAIDGEQMVWTCYPGDITARLPKDFFEVNNLVEGDEVPHGIIPPNCAVKHG